MDSSENILYKCPNCNADLRFHPNRQGFVCEYCDSFFTLEECKAANEAMSQEQSAQAADKEAFAQQSQLFICQSCGAELMTDLHTTATECLYCHSPVVLKGRLSGDYRPSKVIPFKISRVQAVDIFKTWCSRRKFLPKDFVSESHLLHLQGVYVPFWIANCHVHGIMKADCRKIRHWTAGDTQYTEVKEFDVFREADLDFEGIPADGQSKVDDKLMESIEPFDYRETVSFEMAYLSGFLSDKYDVNASQVFPRIKNRAIVGSDQMLRSSMVEYDTVRVTRSEMHVLRTKWEYMLLPVWFLSYQYHGQHYDFAINGQTGKQAGTPPLDKSRVLVLCAGIVIVCGLLGFIGGLLI